MTKPGTDLQPLEPYPGLPPDDWAHTFLTAYAGPEAYGTITRAAKAAGTTAKTVQARRNTDIVFDELMRDAEESIRDTVRHEIFRRALDPNERPIYQRGEIVGTVQEYDTKHLEWLAERFMPEEFHIATKIELLNPGGGPADFTFRMSESDEIEDADVRELADGE